MGVRLQLLFCRKISNSRQLNNNTESRSSESSKSAYDVLGVSESSSFAEIKASFRKLAKETHPDVSPSSSHRFLQILAAYEILSDAEKRAHYDGYLFSQRKILQKHPRSSSVMYVYNSSLTIMKQGEVVEWLKWYRHVIADILTEGKVAVGSGYFYELESELYSAIRAAYYGPLIESMDFLPDCFEAEERSVYDTSEVLHLVSGRDLFGIIYLADKVPELSDTHREKVTSFDSMAHEICKYARQTNLELNPTSWENSDVLEMQHKKGIPDIYRDLELHISGRLVATSTRSPPKCKLGGKLAADCEDQINVFLNLDEDSMYNTEAVPTDTVSSSVDSRILLGTISGLGTKAEEGICSVYDRIGTKTHMIMKHRTLMVKHMWWYQVGDEVSACECRCSRARLPPSKFSPPCWKDEHLDRCSGFYLFVASLQSKSYFVNDGPHKHPSKQNASCKKVLEVATCKMDPEEVFFRDYRFWLFEPRCSMHDIGGWYIETFGRDKKGITIPSQRQWDSMTEHSEKRLHPAMYLLALAYRTLDLENAKRRKRTVRDFVEPKLYGVLRWCKKLV